MVKGWSQGIIGPLTRLKMSMCWSRRPYCTLSLCFGADCLIRGLTFTLIIASALDGDGCRNSAINDVVKYIFRDSRDFNFSIQTFYVPSSHNPADEPSRDLSDLDCMLTPETWLYLERFFGLHSFDLMSLDSNCQRDRNGNPLPHFTPWPTPGFTGGERFRQPFTCLSKHLRFSAF